ncbi:MAG: response regulator transcription factor [Ignavibacteriae bacterium]|nr:response regulator transcription factor [Ignavibacteriota bacterium]
MSIKVAIVEDNPDYRIGTALVVKHSSLCSLVGSYERAEDLLYEFDSVKPEVVLMDIGLPGLNGVEASRQLKNKYPDVQIIILSVFEDDENVFQAICAGACGYLNKPVMPERLVVAVQDAHEGGTPMSPRIARKVLEMFKHFAPAQKNNYDLTEREKEVLKQLVNGDDYKMIAEKLFLSLHTVRAHIRSIYEKLHVHSKSQAVSKALKEQVLS